MEVLSCEHCGALFMGLDKLCGSCKKKDYMDFQEVSEYLRNPKNKNATVIDVAMNTSVSERTISRYIREGRLIVKDMPNMLIACSGCGKLTNRGKLCKECRDFILESGLGVDSSGDRDVGDRRDGFGGAYRTR